MRFAPTLFPQAELSDDGLGRQMELFADAGYAAFLCHHPEMVKIFIVNYRSVTSSVNTNIIAIIIGITLVSIDACL